MPQDTLSHATIYTLYVCACFLIFTVYTVWMEYSIWVQAHVWYMCAWQCTRLSDDCTVVNKQKQALALMKGCCHLFCRRETISAPCGSSDRLFFCITLNKRVQCINLTLLGETKEDPLIQYNNSAKMETWDASATATCYNIITTAQHCCQHRKSMWISQE